jgi:CheY-like chemotaxis protein
VLQLQQKDDLPRNVKSDPIRLRQILINIIGNAIKFTHTGGVTVNIETVHSEKNGEMVLRFKISDTGIGMSEAAKARIFLPFAQADSTTTRKFGGTGLGLALTRKLAIALGGNVELSESRPSEGSTFSVWVSLGPNFRVGDSLNSSDRSTYGLQIEQNAKPLSGFSILVAEDAVDNQKLIKLLLTRYGATVHLVENGQRAVEEAAKNNFDLVLMDLQMPVLDGYQATTQLRMNGFTRPIIALTAHAMVGESEKTKTAGFSDYLTKPINATKLLKALTDLLKP